jgi:hypothetical protein
VTILNTTHATIATSTVRCRLFACSALRAAQRAACGLRRSRDTKPFGPLDPACARDYSDSIDEPEIPVGAAWDAIVADTVAHLVTAFISIEDLIEFAIPTRSANVSFELASQSVATALVALDEISR